MQLLFSEILKIVDEAKTRDEKIFLLRKHRIENLLVLLRINFDLTVKLDLPEGEPPYKVNDAPAGTEHTVLQNELRKIYIWLDPKCVITKVRKETLFIQLLEGLTKQEAELLVLCKCNKLQSKYTTISPELIREAYPDLTLPGDENIARVNITEKKKRGPKPKNK